MRFDAVDGLEYSEDLLIFDLMHVRLVHGWLVDPQDRATASIVGTLSYNQLVEKVIEIASPARPTNRAPPQPTPPPPPPAVAAATGPATPEDAELARALALSLEVQPSSAPPSPPPPSSPPPPPSPPPSPPTAEDEALQAALALSMEQPSLAAGQTTPSRGMSEAILMQDWLATSANQLTYYGLEQLHRSLNESEMVVFFRNNHFSTMTKHAGELYLLATDIGFLQERDIVWERLNQVDGDSTLCDGLFKALDLEMRAAVAARDAAEAAEAAEVAAAMDAADAAAMQQGGGGGGYPGGYDAQPVVGTPIGGPRQAHGRAQGHAQGGGGQGGGGHGEMDPDYALALALQREEEEQAQTHAAAQPAPRHHNPAPRPNNPAPSARGGAPRPTAPPQQGGGGGSARGGNSNAQETKGGCVVS